MQFTKALQHTIGWKALNTILAFFINVLLVRILGASDSGVFFYSIALLSFITLLIGGSIESGITYYGSNNAESFPAIAVFIMLLLILQAFITWVLLHFIPLNLHKPFSWVFIISNLAITYFSALYYARKWFLSINIIVFIANVIVLAGLLYLYITYGSGEDKLLPLSTSEISGQKSVSISSIGDFVNTESYYYGAMVFFGGLLLQAFILMIFYFLSAGFSVTQVAYNPRIIRNIFLYSSVAFISNILFFLVTRVDYYFVQKYCGEIALSNYVQVSKMGQILILLPTMIASVLFPYSSDMKEEGNLNRLQLLCKILSLLFIPATFLIIVFGYWGFPWLFGPGFVLMYRAMLLYLPGFYFLNILTLLAAYLAGKAMLTKNLAASVIALVVVVIGDVLLIPVWGINAAAAISSVAYFLCMVYLLWIFKHEIGCKVQNFFIVNKKDRQLLISKLLK